MLALPNDNQRAFVQRFVETGGRNHSECALAAGYDGSAIHVTGHRLAHDENIQKAIQEEARKMMTAASVMAVGTVMSIASNAAHKDQLQAATAILDRTGLHAIAENKNTLSISVDRKQEIADVIAMCKQIGWDPRTVLGKHGIVLDADFTVVEDLAALPMPEDYDDEDLFTGAAE